MLWHRKQNADGPRAYPAGAGGARPSNRPPEPVYHTADKPVAGRSPATLTLNPTYNMVKMMGGSPTYAGVDPEQTTGAPSYVSLDGTHGQYAEAPDGADGDPKYEVRVAKNPTYVASGTTEA